MSKRTHKLFLRFNSIYGGTWSSRFATERMYQEAVAEWTEDLKDYTDEEIERAIKACKKRHQLAPTLPQFLELVKTERNAKFKSSVPKAERGSKEVAMQAIAQMRETLNQFENSLLSAEELKQAIRDYKNES